jgi:hypothetical protein
MSPSVRFVIAVAAITAIIAGCGKHAATTPSEAKLGDGGDTAGSARGAKPSTSGDHELKADTWIAKLGDSRDAERAITQLEELGDPKAIAPLGKVWEETGKPVRVLQVIIGLARPLTPAQAQERFFVDYEQTGRPARWALARPFLEQAVAEVEESDPRSVDSAQKAADALGEAQLPEGLDALIGLVNKPVSKKLIAAQVSAIRAIGMFRGEHAVAALTKVIDREPPPHPRTAKNEEKAAGEEQYGQFLAVSGAAINALATLRAAASTRVLILAMYRTPELYGQIRRALVASGGGAVPELRKILRGEHAEVNQLFADKHLGEYCGDDGKAPPSRCKPVSLRDFYAAVTLGDFYDAAAAPELQAALKRPATPFYYADGQPSPNTQYNAIMDALRKIGAAPAAGDVKALWMNRKLDLTNRALAIRAYPYVTRDGAGTAELGKIAADDKADDDLRQAAAESFARLANDPKQLDLLSGLIDKYLKASADKRVEADKLKPAFDAAEAKFKAAKQVLDAAEANMRRVVQDAQSTAADIKAATEAGKAAKATFKAAKNKHGDAVAPYTQHANLVKGYHQFARMFQTHIARIEIAIRCQDDTGCYARTLSQTPDDVAAKVAPYIKDLNAWTAEEKQGLVAAQIERAMLELGKRGQKAAAQTEALLDAAKSDDRLIRESILLALPKIAEVPCPICEAKLQAAVKAGEGKATLADLNVETTMLASYFSWMGGKAPTAEVPAEK